MAKISVPKQLWKDVGEIHSQDDVIVKVLVPLLKGLGFVESEMEFNRSSPKPLLIQLGSKKQVATKRPDIAIKTKGKYLLVVEAKPPSEDIDDIAIGQAVSYAVLFGTHFAMVSNGESVEVFRVHSLFDYRQEDLLLNKNQISEQTTPTFSHAESEEAKRSLITFKERKEFANVFNICHDIIRTQRGLSAKERLYEMCKILFVKLVEEDRLYKENQLNRFDRKTFDDVESKGVKAIDFMNKTLFPNANERLSGIFGDETVSLESHTMKELVY